MSRPTRLSVRGHVRAMLVAAVVVTSVAGAGCRRGRRAVEPVPAAPVAEPAAPANEAESPAAPAAAEPETAPTERTLQDSIVVRVHGRAIMHSQVLNAARELIQGEPVPHGVDRQAFEKAAYIAALRRLVARRLIIEAAREENLAFTEEQVLANIREIPELKNDFEGDLDRYLKAKGLSLRQLMEQTEEDMLYRAYLQVHIFFPRVEVTPAEVFAYFNKHRADYQDTRTVNLAAISIFKNENARDKADEALGLLREGVPFADVARKFSEDPTHAPRGGEWGWTDPNDLRGEAVVEAARTLPVGEVSDVLESDLALWIVLVKERRVPHEVTVAEVYRQIERRLFADKAQEETDKVVRRLMEKAPIEPPEVARQLMREF